MRSFEQRRDPARLFLRRLGILALVLLLAVAVSGVWGVYKKERDSYALRILSEAELADLAQRKMRLESDLERLRTDRGVEEELREQYALAGAGERLIIIVDPSSTSPLQAAPAKKGWLARLFGW